MTPSNEVTKIPDLDFHWDPIAYKLMEPEKAVVGSTAKRNIEDYFNFLSDVDPGRNSIKQPPELFNQKFTF
jgi:hypothetical protein